MPTCRQLASWGLAGLVLGCGGGGSGPGPTPSVVIKTAGDAQIGPAGSALATPLEVTVKDAQGNAVSGVDVAFAAATGGGSVAPPSATTGADGKASTVRTLGPGAGAQTTTATVSGVAPASFSSVATINGAVTIAVSGSATRSDTVNGSVVPDLAVLVKDPAGLAVPGIIVTWTVSGGGHLSQLADTTDANGQSTVTWTFDSLADTQTARAAVSGLVGSPVVFTGTAAAATATQIASQSGDLQAGPVSGALPVAVVVTDAYGNGKPGVTVSWAAVGGGSVASPSTMTDAQGSATVSRLLGAIPGAYGTTATVAGLAGSPVTFSDTAVAVTGIQVGNGGSIFNPATATVTHGDFVTFTWAGGVTHNVKWDSAPPGATPPDSPSQTSGSFTVRLTAVGSYAYHCTFHGTPGAGMHGSIDAN
ncbi:MAG TPA: Ig-like domain-containing protein [Gemmatimonadales bacterium]